MRPFTYAFAILLGVCTAANAVEELSSDLLSIEHQFDLNGNNLAFGHDALWVAGGFLAMRIDALTNEVVSIPLDGASQRQRRIAVGEGAVWIPDVGADIVFKIDPETLEVAAEFPVEMLSTHGSVDVGAGSLWVVSAENFEKTLVRLDLVTGEVQAKVVIPTSGAGVLFAHDSVWVSSGSRNELYRVDPTSNAITSSIETGASPRFAAAGADSIWLHNHGDATVQRIDPHTETTLATINTGLPFGTGDIAFGGGYVWLVAPKSIPLVQIDPSTNTLVSRYKGSAGAEFIRFGGGSLWIGGPKLKRLTPPISQGS